MSEANWDCPMCGTENNTNVIMKDFDKEALIESTCYDCDITSELTIRMQPYVDWIDVKE